MAWSDGFKTWIVYVEQDSGSGGPYRHDVFWRVIVLAKNQVDAYTQAEAENPNYNAYNAIEVVS